MRRRWHRHIQTCRQSLSWLRVSRDRLQPVEYDVNVREPQARALVAAGGGACGSGGGFAQPCRPWIRVYSDRIGAFADSNFVLLGAPDFRFGTRGFCTSSIGDEHQSDENGRDGDPKLRREKEQEEIVSRFESLLPKWSSNTPLLLNDLQVNFSSVMHVSCTPCIRGPSLTC
jgi:hypothetical protein